MDDCTSGNGNSFSEDAAINDEFRVGDQIEEGRHEDVIRFKKRVEDLQGESLGGIDFVARF